MGVIEKKKIWGKGILHTPAAEDQKNIFDTEETPGASNPPLPEPRKRKRKAPPPYGGEKVLTPGQLAEKLQVSRGTIYSWICRGISVPPFIKNGKALRFREAAVEVWILEKEKENQNKKFGV